MATMKKDIKIEPIQGQQTLKPEEATALVMFYREQMLKCKSDEEFLKIQQVIADTLSQGGDIKKAIQELSKQAQNSNQNANESFYYIDPSILYGTEKNQNGEVVEEGFLDNIQFGAKAAWNGLKGLVGKGKDPTEVYYDRVDHYRKKLARVIGEMNMDLKDMGWDPSKYPEIEKAFKELKVQAQSAHQHELEGVVTKWDKIRHTVGRLVGAVVVNGVVVMGLNAIIPGLGSPYLHKGMVGAATAFVRDITQKGRSIKNKQDRAIMLKNALIGFGIGMTVQLASEMLNPQVDHQQIHDTFAQRSFGFNGQESTGQVDINGDLITHGNFGTKVRALFDSSLPKAGFHGNVDINAAHQGFTDLASKLAGRQMAADDVKASLQHAVSALADKGATKDQIAQIMNDGLGKLANGQWGPYLGKWLPDWSIFNHFRF